MLDVNSLPAPVKAEFAARALSRRSLISFTKRFYPKYEAGWIHHDIAKRLEQFSRDVVAKKSPRLAIFMPPRHGKSELASIRFPAWHLGSYPDHEIINCGYNLDLPMKFSRKVREIVRDPGYNPLFPDTKLDPESQSAEAWNTLHGGGFTAAGVGGGITGKGAHILIIDDPVKNQEEADSVTTRDGVWEWYWSTAYTRLAPGGGVLLIQCMTGDTPVLLPDGTECRLDGLVVGAEVATYDQGRLSTSKVSNFRSNGTDKLLRITTTSGKMVRANGRHPFLTLYKGDLAWTRAKDLTTAHKIVALKESGASGKALYAQMTDANSLLSAEAYAPATTASRSGRQDHARQAPTQNPAETLTSSTGTASAQLSTTSCSPSRAGYAQCAGAAARPDIGEAGLQSTTATTPDECGGYSATTATWPSGTLKLSKWHLPQLGTSDFTTEDVTSIEDAGEEEVFDVQVERTENFIANGLVSHNTRWHDDDLGGRILSAMRADERADQFDVVTYPALADSYEFIHEPTNKLVRVTPDELGPSAIYIDSLPRQSVLPAELDSPIVGPEEHRLVRTPGEPLHAARYDRKMMDSIKANQTPRVWSALYQQNPVPDEGMFFQKDWIQYEPQAPRLHNVNVFQAWDFAIGEKAHNDWTVGITLIQDENNNLHFVDMVRIKGDSHVITEAIVDFAEKWGSERTCPLTVGFEDTHIWRAIRPYTMQIFESRSFYPTFEELRPLTDKLARAAAIQGRMQHGKFWFLRDAPFAETAVNEMLRFPAGVHDDIVDALAWGVNLCVSKKPRPQPKQRERDSWKDKLNGFVGGPDGAGHMAA